MHLLQPPWVLGRRSQLKAYRADQRWTARKLSSRSGQLSRLAWCCVFQRHSLEIFAPTWDLGSPARSLLRHLEDGRLNFWTARSACVPWKSWRLSDESGQVQIHLYSPEVFIFEQWILNTTLRLAIYSMSLNVFHMYYVEIQLMDKILHHQGWWLSHCL